MEGLTVPDSEGEGRQLSKILVVDDDAFSAGLIDNTLRASGFMSSYTTKSTEAPRPHREGAPRPRGARRVDARDRRLAERIRSRVAGESFEITDARGQPSGESISLTVSVGVAIFEPGDSPPTIIAKADRALYEAKNAGRNAVRVAAPKGATEPPAPPEE